MKIFKMFLRLYRALSFLKPSCCRFYPSCSTYALWLLEHERLDKALWRSARRLLACNPYCQGGIDYPIGSKPLQPKFSAPITPLYFLIPKHPNTFIPYYILKVSSERQ
ncbi:membrane protein insertion efficiency factor YidD [Helicobacter labacensis]|uniref:membrane protein insertion efficiency factor YidD n=1 Tax=Helicobacter labacensis TaxID=2316079 RepID=UPI000EB1FDC3|nr:membrane protein insertion efficiency factor YidD [Helicobacter labacensis]